MPAPPLPSKTGNARHPLPDGRELWLLPERAAFLPDTPQQSGGLLLVADAHFGKAASFRRLGVPVPQGTTEANLARLDALLSGLQAEAASVGPVRRLVFLGDFLHAATGRAPATLQALADWRARHAGLPMTLVRGNHDDRAGDPPAALAIEAVDEPCTLAGLALCHHPHRADLPDCEASAYRVAGHVHPVTRLGHGHDSLRLPCFHAGPQGLVLPAFGEFTGGAMVRPSAGQAIYVVVEDRVLKLPAAPESGGRRR